MTVDPADLAAAVARAAERPWPGPDRYTLLAWVELELALEGGARLDAAHAVLSDGIVRAFGPGMYGWVAEALAAEGRDPQDLAVLLDDEDLADRVLAALHERMGADDQAPEPPDAHLVWSAFSPETRRAVGVRSHGRCAGGSRTPAGRSSSPALPAWPAGASAEPRRPGGSGPHVPQREGQGDLHLPDGLLDDQ